MRMTDREIVCRTMRQLTPDRQWYYLGETERYLLSCMVDDLRKDLVEENQRLRKELRETDAVRAENAKLRNLMQKSIDEQLEACGSWDNQCDMCDCSCFVSENRNELRTLGFRVDQWTE